MSSFTRKIERLCQKLGIESISASQVSEINKELNEQVADFSGHNPHPMEL
jgi:transposase-like protein